MLIYSRLFGSEPTVVKTDYAKWMVEDPRLNFAISARGAAPGLNHLGFGAATVGAKIKMKSARGCCA